MCVYTHIYYIYTHTQSRSQPHTIIYIYLCKNSYLGVNPSTLIRYSPRSSFYYCSASYLCACLVSYSLTVFPCSLADADYLTLRANLQQRQSSLGVAAQRKGASQVAAKAARAALAAATQSAAKAAVASALSQARREQASICRERAQAQAAQKAAAKAAELAKSLLAQRAERAERAQCRERRDPRAIWLSQCAAKAHQQAAGLLETEAPQSALGQQAATLSIRGRVAAELRGAAAGTAVAAGSGALQLEQQTEAGHSGPPARPPGRRERSVRVVTSRARLASRTESAQRGPSRQEGTALRRLRGPSRVLRSARPPQHQSRRSSWQGGGCWRSGRNMMQHYGRLPLDGTPPGSSRTWRPRRACWAS